MFRENKNHENFSLYGIVYTQQLLFWMYLYIYIYLFIYKIQILSFVLSMTIKRLRNSHYELSNIRIMFEYEL
jgi:hypothetical protein